MRAEREEWERSEKRGKGERGAEWEETEGMKMWGDEGREGR